MPRDARIKLYKEIETHRKRPLVAYYTSKRPGIPPANMVADAVPYIVEQLDALGAVNKELDIMIVSLGGDPMVAWRIMSLVRQRESKVSVLVPEGAWSAATLLALGGEEIIMHPNGNLGPIDMQITMVNDHGQPKQFSTEEISAFLEFIRDDLKITEQEHIRALFEVICREVSSLGIGFTARSSKLAIDLSKRLLGFHITEEQKINLILEKFKKFQSHAYPINRSEAKEIGLPIAASDPVLEKLMWEVWLDAEAELLERKPFSALSEFLGSAEGGKLLSGIPQLILPINVVGGPSYQTTLQDALALAKETVNPVDFELKTAIVESARFGHIFTAKGKILACRGTDLSFPWNAVTTSRTWDKI